MDRRQFLWSSGGAIACAAIAPGVRAAPTFDRFRASEWGPRRRFLKGPFGKVAYLDEGTGDPALFLHGYPLNGFQWRHSVEQLSLFCRCVVPDFLGLGATEAAEGQDLSVGAQAGMLISLLDALRLERELVPVKAPPAQREWLFGHPIGAQTVFEVPLSEIILLQRHLNAREIHTYLSGAGLADIRDPATPPPKAVGPDGRSSQRFLVEAVVVRQGHRRRVVASGQDIYAFTAPLVCEAAQRLVTGRSHPPGAHAPGELFDPHEFLSALTPNPFSLGLRK